MKLVLPLFLLVTLFHFGSSNDCQSNCCQDSSAECSGTNCQTDCCESSSTKCSSGNCQTNCCQSADAQCSGRNCRSKCCQTSTTKCVSRCETTTKCCRPCPPPAPTTTESPMPTPARVVSGCSSSSCNSHNENNSSMDATINISNTVKNDNHIYMPITLNSTNIQSVQIIPASPNTQPPHTIPTPITPTPSPVTPCPTVPTPQPPVTIPVPIPYPVPQPNCCIIIIPCATINCNPYRRVCGSSCSSSMRYMPTNPCSGGCNRMDYFQRTSCRSFGQCYNTVTDCSQCSQDYYRSYSGYQTCGGCFRRK